MNVPTIITLVSGIGTYTLVFLIIVLASKDLLPEDPDGTLFHIVASILAVMLMCMVVGIAMSAIVGRRERKKQKTDNGTNTNTRPL